MSNNKDHVLTVGEFSDYRYSQAALTMNGIIDKIEGTLGAESGIPRIVDVYGDWYQSSHFITFNALNDYLSVAPDLGKVSHQTDWNQRNLPDILNRMVERANDGGFDEARWVYNFEDNTGDMIIEFPDKLFNFDDPNLAFEIEGYFMAGSDSGTFISQNHSYDGPRREFQIYRISRALVMIAGGEYSDLALSTDHDIAKDGLWNFRYRNGLMTTKFNGKLMADPKPITIGSAREPEAKTRLFCRWSYSLSSDNPTSHLEGPHRDIKIWINGDRTDGDLVVDLPLNDNTGSVLNRANGTTLSIENHEQANWQRLSGEIPLDPPFELTSSQEIYNSLEITQ